MREIIHIFLVLGLFAAIAYEDSNALESKPDGEWRTLIFKDSEGNPVMWEVWARTPHGSRAKETKLIQFP